MKKESLIIRIAWIVALFFILMSFACEKDEAFVQEIDSVKMEEMDGITAHYAAREVPFKGHFYGSSLELSPITPCGGKFLVLPTEYDIKGKASYLDKIRYESSSLRNTNCTPILDELNQVIGITYESEFILVAAQGDILAISNETTFLFDTPDLHGIINGNSEGKWYVNSSNCTGRFLYTEGRGNSNGVISFNPSNRSLSYNTNFSGVISPPGAIKNIE
jgi:hypothetical protein